MKKPITSSIFIGVLIVGAVIGVVLSLKLYPRKSGQWKQVTIATATPGGTYYLLGDELAGILRRLPGKPIERVVAEPSSGAVKNIELLLNPSSTANVAFVMKPALLQAIREKPEARQELRILARLYMDVVQVVVRNDTRIANVMDLKNKRVFVGPVGSGTRMITTQILKSIGFSEGNYTADDATKFAQAADRLIVGELDAAFFMAGTPTVAVETALKSGECELLNLDPNTLASLTERDRELGLKEWDIPAHLYENQPNGIKTVAADVFLVCRSDLDEDLAFVILKALFDNITELLFVHTKAQEIRLTEAFKYLPLPLHSGARKFKDEEDGKLLIATGALNGRYYLIGKTIQEILEPLGIPARAIHTDGSVENAELLTMNRPMIAIMQYDAAIASRIGKPELVYHEDLSDANIRQVDDIRRIAALHKEQVHVVIRRQKLEEIRNKVEEKFSESKPQAITSLDKLRDELLKSEEKISVCVGPKGSATQLVAQAILKYHNIGIESVSIRQSFLPVPDMVERLQNKEIDMGFFVSYVPSEALKTILNDGRMRLLSLGPKERAAMSGRVFTTSTIDPNMYGCQKKDELAIQTLATKAVLVTTDLVSDVKAITKAIFEGEAYLGIAAKTMAEYLPSLPLHPYAERYYKKAGLLPSEPRFDWLRATWTTLGCLVMITAGYKGLIMLRRDKIGNRIGRRILAISLEASARDSVQRLLKIRDEIQERVRKRWWRSGELDKHRWRYLRDLIHDRIGEAKENLTREFVAEIRDVAHYPELGKATRKQRYRSIEDRILEYFEKAELDPTQQKMLRELLRETSQQDTKITESKGIKK